MMSFLDEEFDYLDEVIIEKEELSTKKERDELKQKYEEVSVRRTFLEKENRILKANISSLFKTAVAEIERKNSQISELRKELDDLILRRHKRQHRDEPKPLKETETNTRKRQRTSPPRFSSDRQTSRSKPYDSYRDRQRRQEDRSRNRDIIYPARTR
jgi:hypothetical protein